jgi:uncharacterized protein (DUF305 family)
MRPRIVVALAAVVLSACSDMTLPSAPTALDTPAPAAIAGVPSAGGTVTTSSTAAPSPAAANYEQKFMMGMIDHHQMAVETAEMCVSKAVHDELRQLCQSIIAAQTQEIQQMQDWLRKWYGVSYSPQTSNSARKDMARLAAANGAEFETMFMDMMIRHHRAAVNEGQTCLERAYHRQLIELCENIITTQSAEIAQMEEWLCQWYGRCASA